MAFFSKSKYADIEKTFENAYESFVEHEGSGGEEGLYDLSMIIDSMKARQGPQNDETATAVTVIRDARSRVLEKVSSAQEELDAWLPREQERVTRYAESAYAAAVGGSSNLRLHEYLSRLVDRHMKSLRLWAKTVVMLKGHVEAEREIASIEIDNLEDQLGELRDVDDGDMTERISELEAHHEELSDVLAGIVTDGRESLGEADREYDRRDKGFMTRLCSDVRRFQKAMS